MKRPGIILLTVFIPCFLQAQGINRYDVIISEVMADPTPQVGLPNNEWIELKNTSGVTINLQDWRIGDASGQSGPMPAFNLQRYTFIICNEVKMPVVKVLYFIYNIALCV